MKRYPRLTVYKAKDGWRWRLKGANGRVLADGGEGYVSARNCIHGAARALNLWEPDVAEAAERELVINRDGFDGDLTVRIEGER